MVSEEYRSAVARLLSHHEAGHVVVGHALGRKIRQAMTDRVFWQKQADLPNPTFANSKKERARRIAEHRRQIAVAVAGCIAAEIHQRAVEKHGYSSPRESRAYSAYWNVRISGCFPTVPDPNPIGDYAVAVGGAGMVSLAKTMERLSEGATSASELIQSAKQVDPEKEVLAEIERMEAKAERILKRHWAAVTEIAEALHKSKHGKLTRKRLLAILDRHGVKQR